MTSTFEYVIVSRTGAFHFGGILMEGNGTELREDRGRWKLNASAVMFWNSGKSWDAKQHLFAL